MQKSEQPVAINNFWKNIISGIKNISLRKQPLRKNS